MYTHMIACAFLVHLTPFVVSGLQDITTTVDFTEAAEAGEAAGWRTAAYAPIFQLEPGTPGERFPVSGCLLVYRQRHIYI